MKLMTRPEWQQDWEQIERALRSQLRRRGINARTEASEETLQEARCLVLDRLAAGKCIALAVWLAAADAARGRRFIRQSDYDSPAQRIILVRSRQLAHARLRPRRLPRGVNRPPAKRPTGRSAGGR